MGDKNEIDIMWFDVVLLQARENTCPAIYKKINIVGFHVKAGIKSSTASKGVTATRHRESDRFHFLGLCFKKQLTEVAEGTS